MSPRVTEIEFTKELRPKELRQAVAEQIEAAAEVGWTETEVGSQIVAEAVTGEAR